MRDHDEISHTSAQAVLGRRRFLGLTAAMAGGLAVAGPAVPSATALAASEGSASRSMVDWIDRCLVPLSGADPQGDLRDLRSLGRVVGDATVVGLGESAHGTHTQLALKHRVARYLVEELGFRTIAWEESWGCGVAIDRYVVTGKGDPRVAVGDMMSMLRTHGMLELVEWMRAFNRRRPERDRVRFLGSDSLELRQVQYDEITQFVADVAPERSAELAGHLRSIAIRGSMREHFGWYLDPEFTDELKQPYIEHARSVYELLCALPSGASSVDREDAVQHAYAILGFYDSYTAAGEQDDRRDAYVAETVRRWQRRTGHRLVYSAANAHTAASRQMLISFPDEFPGDDTAVRRLAGGRLRRHYGRHYVSIGTVFHEGDVLTGWESGAPAVFAVPSPSPSFIDHVLGQAHRPDYLLDLRLPAPPVVRRQLDGAATMRIIGSAYDAGIDALYSQRLDSWREGFDAVLHIHHVEASRLLS